VTSATWSTAITSVTTARPVSSRASASSSSPFSARPWNEYGFVRGLNAPPRRPDAPASFTACAVSRSCDLFSTLHGPAITATRLPPTFASGRDPSDTTVRSFLTSLDAILYGARIGTTRSTPSTVSTTPRSLKRSSPMTATTVRSVPVITCSFKPISRTS
jgi:hypothetical protein